MTDRNTREIKRGRRREKESLCNFRCAVCTDRLITETLCLCVLRRLALAISETLINHRHGGAQITSPVELQQTEVNNTEKLFIRLIAESRHQMRKPHSISMHRVLRRKYIDPKKKKPIKFLIDQIMTVKKISLSMLVNHQNNVLTLSLVVSAMASPQIK